ncbi:MAG: TetR/AcrR family transcriptional regulator [Candidatus Binatia bacterium]
MTTGPLDPSLGESRTTRERILDAAEQVFAEKGLGAAPVRDIAARVGLNPASLYNHFAGKEELYEAVLERGLTPVLEMLSDLMGGARTRDREELVIDRVVLHFAASPNLAKLIHYETLAGGERLARIAGRWFEPVYQRGIEVLHASRAAEVWSEEDLPLLLLAFQNLIVGYFAMAPLVRQVFGFDPVSEEGISRQTAFLHRVAHLLVPPREE